MRVETAQGVMPQRVDGDQHQVPRFRHYLPILFHITRPAALKMSFSSSILVNV